MTENSKILQQPLDVIELDLRARAVPQAAAELLEDAADALGVDLAGDLDRVVVAQIAAVKRATERIGLIAAALLAAGPVAGTIPLPVAIALLHRLGHLLRTLAQGVERLALRVHGAIRIAVAELRAGIAHGAVGGVQTAVVITVVAVLIAILAGLSLLALLALLPLLTFLAFLSLLREAAL